MHILPPSTLGRFSLVRQLGEGGFGVVFEAEDKQYGSRFALKVLRRDHEAAVTRFKREFRSLADISHPNLVRLYELAAEGEAWFFTMELVAGVTFLEHVRGADGPPEVVTEDLSRATRVADRGGAPHGALDGGRLRAATSQLVRGVEALHRAGKVHCDIKPSNVLVTEAGRVVLLDFGLAADLNAAAAGPRRAMGTPGYVAPEQARGCAVTPASDWFSVGVMLHEALTGAMPGVPGMACQEPTSDLADLRSLCADLLHEQPERRPTGPEMARRLRGDRPDAAGDVVPGEGKCLAFVGRQAELYELWRAWHDVGEDRPVVVYVEGASGIGKTSFVHHFLDEIRRADGRALALVGRCYEQESVPYKALDSLMDVLGEYLVTLSAAEREALLPPNAAMLSRLFPAFEEAGIRSERTESWQGGDAQVRRRHAFLALRELIASLAARRRLVLFLDDVQWGDVDSARLVGDLLRPPQSPPVMIIASHRPVDASEGFLTALREMRLDVDQRTISMAALAPDEARILAARLVGESEPTEASDAIASESAGSPMFIQQMAQRVLARGRQTPAGAPSLNAMIVEHLADLDAEARHLIEAVAIAGQPMPESVVFEAAELDRAAAAGAMLAARHARLLVTRAGADSLLVEPTHDRVREAIAASLPAGMVKRYNGRLAAALLAEAQPDPETLVRLFEGAGDRPRTREFALKAAERAEGAFAFDRAARHYELVLTLCPTDDPERWRLLERRGDALGNAGRSAAAAEAFEEAGGALAAQEPDHSEILSLRRRSGELTLRSGRIELGTERMNAVLRRVGVSPPRSRATAAAVSAVRRLRLFARGTRLVPRTSSRATAAIGARLDALWGASTGLSMVNHVVADALGLQHMLEVLASGDTSRLVRSIGYEAAFEAVIGGGFLNRRCQKLLQLMDTLACASDAPYDRAWALMSKGVASWFLGDWASSWESCDRAATLYREHCRGVAWERAICDAYRLPALAYLGRLDQLTDLVPIALEEARERGDLFAASMLRLGQQSMVLLAANQPERALTESSAAVASFPTAVYLLPHYHHLFAFAQAEIYRGNAAAAWRRIDAEWRPLKQSRLLMVQCLRVEIRHLRARAALALGRDGQQCQVAPIGRLRGSALTEASAIERDVVAPARPLAAAIRAAVARLDGRADDVVRHLREALAGFEVGRMGLYAEAARDRLGESIGGSEGALLRDQAARWMAAQKVKNPVAMIGMLLPGV